MGLLDYNTKKTNLLVRDEQSQRYLDEGRAIAQEKLAGVLYPEIYMQDITDDEYIEMGRQRIKEKTKRTLGGTIKDVAVSSAKGVVGLGEAAVGLADIPTLGRVGKGMEKYLGYDPAATQEFLSQGYSSAQKAAFEEVEKAKGFVGTAKAMLKHPSTIGHAVVESAPQMLGGAAAARKLVASGMLKMTPVWKNIIAASIGEGLVSAGATAEGIRQQTEDGVLTPKQAAISAISGAGTTLFAVVGGRVAQKFGIIDPDTFLAGGSNVTSTGVIKRIIGGGITEGAFEELPQSMQEQVWLNAALDKPLLEGVGEAGATGTLTGFAMGAGFNIFTGKPYTKAEKETTATPDEINQVKADIKSGLISEGIKSGDLTSEMMAPAIERIATQDPALAKQLADMFVVKETDLSENERRFEEDPLDAENNAEFLDKYIKKSALSAEKTKVALEEVGVEIPDFKTTGEAYAFGEKATPEQVKELQRLVKAQEKAGKLQEAMDEAIKHQFYNEALQKVEGTEQYKKFKPEPKEVPKTGTEKEKVEVTPEKKEAWEMTPKEWTQESLQPTIEKMKIGETKVLPDKRIIVKSSQDLTYGETYISRSPVKTKMLDPSEIDQLPDKIKNFVERYEAGEKDLPPIYVSELMVNPKTGETFREIRDGHHRYYMAEEVGLEELPAMERVSGLYPEEHEAIVRNALKKGENVPENVLAEYPDLKPQPEGAKPQPPKIEKPKPKLPRTEDLEGEGIPEVALKTWKSEFAETYKKSEFSEPERWDEFKAFSKKEYAEGFPISEHFEGWMAKSKPKPKKEKVEVTKEDIEAFIKPLHHKYYLEGQNKGIAVEKLNAYGALQINKLVGSKLRANVDMDAVKQYLKEHPTKVEVTKKAGVEVTAEKKEPWQMGENEYVQSRLEDLKGKIKLTGQARNLYLIEWQDKFTVTHQRSVEKAIQEGKLPKPKKEKVEVETTPEGKEISVDLTKKEEAAVTPKQQKEYLLAEIDKAIEEAPDVEVETFTYPEYPAWGSKEAKAEWQKEESVFLEQIEERNERYGMVTIHVPDDGIFTIVNAKQTLTEFKKKAKKFPATYSKAKATIPGVIRKTPLKEDIGEIKTARGGKYFSDGSLIIKGKPPAKAKYSEKAVPQERIKDLLATKTKPAELKYYAFDDPDIGQGVGTTPIPSALIGEYWKPMVVFQAKDGTLYNYGQLKFNAITKRFPKAKYGISKEEQGLLIAYEGKEPVAALMPVKIRTGEEEVVMKDMAIKQGFIKGKLEKPTGVEEGTGVRDEKAFATKATKPQETITRKDLRKIFKRMKHIRTGQDSDGNLWFKAEGRPKITIFELDNITGHLNTSAGQIPVGSFLRDTIELKTGGKGHTADIGTAYHEFHHFLERQRILSSNDITALNRTIAKIRGISESAVTEEHRAYYVGDNISAWETQKNPRIRRILRKLTDFMNAIYDFAAQAGWVKGRERTAENVLSDIGSGAILKSKQAESLMLTDTEAGKQFATKPTKDYRDMLKRYQVKHTTPLVDELTEAEEKPSFLDTLEPVTSEDYLLNRKASKSIKLTAITNIKRVAAEIAEGVDKFLGSTSTRIGRVSLKLKSKLRKLDFDINTKYAADVKSIHSLLKKAKKMNRDDFADWDYARKNSDIKKINELIDKYDMRSEYEAYRKVLDDTRKEGLDVGLVIGEIEEYAPRILKDDRGFLKEIGKPEYRPLYSDQLKKRAQDMKMSVESLPLDLKADIISNIMLGGWVGLGGIPATKHRVLQKIPANLNKYYMHSDAALMQHLYSMRKGIEARKFFGEIPKKVKEIRKRLYHVQSQIRELSKSLKGKLSETELAKIKKQRNKYISLEKQYMAYIQKYALQRDYTENIGAYIVELIEKKEIDAKHERIVNDMLKARFHEVGTRGVIQMYKNLSYIDTMGSPISALTQIGDMAWAMYEGGLIRSLKYAYKAAVKKSRITKEDVGVERIAQEFADSGTLGDVVSKVFKIVGLEKIDSIGKEALLNTALEKYQGRAKKGPLKLKRELTPIFENETDSVIEDLVNDEISENVKLLVYSRLLDFQPVALSEMPQRYLDAGNGRLFYMLKTFTLKVFDVFRNESYNKIRYGNKADKIQGMKNFVRLSLFFVLANAGADELKDWVLGRKTDFEDRIVDNVLRLCGVSKFVTWKARTEGVGSALARQILPPFKFIDSAGKDIITAGDEKGLEVIGSIPVVGKLAYWHIGRGTSKREDLWNRRLRKQKTKLNKIKDGLEKTKNKMEYRRKYRVELRKLRQINELQGTLNDYRKRINRLKSMKETPARKKQIQTLEVRRTELIKNCLSKN